MLVPVSHEFLREFISVLWSTCFTETVLYPLRTAKVRIQLQGPADRLIRILTTRNVLESMFKRGGFRSLYGGITAEYLRQIVYQGVRVSFYYPVSQYYSKLLSVEGENGEHLGNRVLTSVTIGLFSVALIQPMVVVKIRYQSGFYSKAVTIKRALRRIYRTEGFRGYFCGLSSSIVRVGISQTIETVAEVIVPDFVCKTQKDQHELFQYLATCFLSAVLIAVITNPIDVMRSRYINAYSTIYRNMLGCVKRTYQKEGAAAFYRGLLPYFFTVFIYETMTMYFDDKRKLAFKRTTEIEEPKNV